MKFSQIFFWELAILKIWGFFNWPFWKKNQENSLFFASCPWKLVKVSWVARMGQTFDDYPGFQPKTTPAQRYATQSTFIFCGRLKKTWTLPLHYDIYFVKCMQQSCVMTLKRQKKVRSWMHDWMYLLQ